MCRFALPGLIFSSSSFSFRVLVPQFRTYSFGGPPRRQRASTDAEQGAGGFATLFQFVPLLILVLFMMFSASSPPREPSYNMDKMNPYNVERFTHWNKVPYYVKTSFERAEVFFLPLSSSCAFPPLSRLIAKPTRFFS